MGRRCAFPFLFRFSKYYKLPEKAEPLKELSAEDIYAVCSPAVFYIEIYDLNGKKIGSGSGFFIDDKGTAVTNYHVIKDAYSAKAQLITGEEMIPVEGYYDYNSDQDWAIIKVSCENTAYLKVGAPETVVGAATVYAIGSPLGLQNTITQGIISNTARKDEETGVTFIQTSAALSSGSSGGALINKYGQVIGITSAGYKKGQNLNLAVPINVIDGYNSEELQSFNPLGFSESTVESADPSQRRYFAFEVLKSFIFENGQSTNSKGYKEYRTTSYGENMQLDCFMYYEPSEDEVIARVRVYYTDDKTEITATAHFTGYDFTTKIDYTYTEENNDKYEAKASGVLLNSDFISEDDYKFSFDDYVGIRGVESSHVSLAMSLHHSLLAFTNQIFAKAMLQHGIYTVADLGYTNFEA